MASRKKSPKKGVKTSKTSRTQPRTKPGLPKLETIDYAKVLSEQTRGAPVVKLTPNYSRLVKNMKDHGVPVKVARDWARRLQNKQNSLYAEAPRKKNGQVKKSSKVYNDFVDWFDEDFQETLYEEYGYNLREDYPTEE